MTGDDAVVPHRLTMVPMPARYSVECSEHGTIAVDLTPAEAMREQCHDPSHLSRDAR